MLVVVVVVNSILGILFLVGLASRLSLSLFVVVGRPVELFFRAHKILLRILRAPRKLFVSLFKKSFLCLIYSPKNHF